MTRTFHLVVIRSSIRAVDSQRAICILALLLATPVPVAAVVSNSVSYNISGSVTAGSFNTKSFGKSDARTGRQVASAGHSDSASISLFGPSLTPLSSAEATVTGLATAINGELFFGLRGRVSGNNNGNPAWFASASLPDNHVTARWQDSVVLSLPGASPPGRRAQVFASLTISSGRPDFVMARGDIAENRDISAEFILDIDGEGVPPGPFGGHFAEYYDNLRHSPFVKNPPPTVIPIVIEMIDGEAHAIDYSVSLSLNSELYSAASTPGFALVEFEKSYQNVLRWGGITKVIDAATGFPIEGWSITSESGRDYARPAPEPASLTIIAIAGYLSLRVRIRSASRRCKKQPRM